MELDIEVVYSDGVFKPLEPLTIPENQRMRITLHAPTDEQPEQILAAWHKVFEGLSDQEIAEIERIALKVESWHVAML